LSAKREQFVSLEMRDPYYRERDLPHYSPNDAPYFVTFNLEGAIPKRRREEYMRTFMEYEKLLHVATGADYLRKSKLAEIVFGKLKWLEGQVAELQAFTVMHNHVHLLMTLHADQSLGDTLRLVKGSTARQCNKLLERTGTFWQDERFDRVMRKKEFWPTVRYILRNRVKAGLVADWREYPWTHIKPEILQELIDHHGGV
jgi:putative transposase